MILGLCDLFFSNVYIFFGGGFVIAICDPVRDFAFVS